MGLLQAVLGGIAADVVASLLLGKREAPEDPPRGELFRR